LFLFTETDTYVSHVSDMFAGTPEEDVFGVGIVRTEHGGRKFVIWLKPQTTVVAGWYDQDDLIVSKP